MSDFDWETLLKAGGISGASLAGLTAIFVGLKTIIEKILDIVKTCKEENKTKTETVLACVNALAGKSEKKKEEPKKKNKN